MNMQKRYLQKMINMLNEKRYDAYLKVFDLLTGYNQDEDKELWQELRKALKENKAELEADKLGLEHITMMQDDNALRKNWWWYYPDRWIDEPSS